ncbi:hypothetical protein J2045_003411 [Peteryoungia aggregata LMG 23059]|uniref:Uncharacterized protein n=1 Tax=Peteryoungia aggregata LMG 23059 TaxID=1368425 RepID=A0ABU0GB78_9HYPH|nr:hypothetical protein [Peteryoungia aggregata]MDQ0422363.1 hypothetical protein [Peteryoungia aggregata LMG 23059]
MTRLFRKGDVISLTGVIETDQRTPSGHEAGPLMTHVRVDGHHSPFYVEADLVTLLVPHFNPNDKVVSTEFVGTGTVRAIFGPKAWVEIDGRMQTLMAADLRLESEGKN